MDRPQEPVQETGRRIFKFSIETLMRKTELFFFFAFIILAVAYFVVPHVSSLKIAPFYVAAGFAVLYAIGLYFLRFKLYVHFGLMLHLGIFLLLSSTICFEIQQYRTGTAMIVIGVLSVAIIFVYATLGKPVIARRQDQPRQQVGVQANEPFDDEEEDDLDPEFLFQPMDLDQGVPNGHAVHMRDFPPGQNPDINEQVIQQEENANEQDVQRDPNEQDIQREDQAVQREVPNEQVVQREEPGEPAVDQEQNLNEHIVPDRE